MLKPHYLFFVFILITSCKSTSFLEGTQPTTQAIVLGQLGENKNFLLEKGYTNTAIPNYRDPIKLDVSFLSFNKKTYYRFVESKSIQNAKLSINYVDSLETKPQFLKFKINDHETLVSALNNRDNTRVKTFLESKPETHVVTEISVAFNNDNLKTIAKAHHVFLVQTSTKTYSLKLYKNGKLIKTLALGEGVVFEYAVSNTCWQANSAYRINIVGLAKDNVNCPKQTYSSAREAKNQIDFFKL